MNVFLKFNKIRTLTTDSKEIAKSLKYSTQLELNQEGTMVRRLTSFVEPTQKDIDKKTIYVVWNIFLCEVKWFKNKIKKFNKGKLGHERHKWWCKKLLWKVWQSILY